MTFKEVDELFEKEERLERQVEVEQRELNCRKERGEKFLSMFHTYMEGDFSCAELRGGTRIFTENGEDVTPILSEEEELRIYAIMREAQERNITGQANILRNRIDKLQEVKEKIMEVQYVLAGI